MNALLMVVTRNGEDDEDILIGFSAHTRLCLHVYQWCCST